MDTPRQVEGQWLEPRHPIEAILCDMDGVVADTALAHAASWKRLFDAYLEERGRREGRTYEPFDAVHDYRRYVDGRSREDGVAAFLAARGIELPWGDREDGFEALTIHGLGNRKNRYFQAWLEDHPARLFPGSLRLLQAARAAGLKTAVFSASRNAAAVLESAGVLGLFDARVDGEDAAKLGLAGKPAPDLLLEAARRLGAQPDRCAVLEDAIAGVEAGRRGGFGLVIGVAREGDGSDLRAAGADLVIRDLGNLMIDEERRLVLRTPANLPSVLERQDELRQRLAGRHVALFLDFDGTLAPIVEDPAAPTLSKEMRAAIEALTPLCAVALISGRGLDDLRARAEVPGTILSGSHGFEIAMPDGRVATPGEGSAFLADLDRAEVALRRALGGIPGHQIERKRFAIAVHYRRVPEPMAPRVEAAVREVIAAIPTLRWGGGKKVFDIKPRTDWHKGRAVRWLLQGQGLEGPHACAIYVGDDVTDEDAFESLAGIGIGIVVRDGDRPTAADFAVEGVGGVARFLAVLATMIGEGRL